MGLLAFCLVWTIDCFVSRDMSYSPDGDRERSRDRLGVLSKSYLPRFIGANPAMGLIDAPFQPSTFS